MGLSGKWNLSLMWFLGKFKPKAFLFCMICLVSLTLLAIFVQSFPGYFPIDDSYICLGFARNVVEHGDFFAYNHGEISTGITSPFYALALAAFYGVVHDWHAAVLLLGVITYLAALVTGGWLAYRIAGYWASVGFVCLWGFSGHMALFALCGMEPMLYVALAFGAFCAFFLRRPFVAGFLTGLAMLCRPESVFILFVMGITLCIEAVSHLFRKEKAAFGETVVQGLKMGCGFLIPVLPWVFRCETVSNTVFSSTVAKKTHFISLAESYQFWKQAVHMHFAGCLDNILVANIRGPDVYERFRQFVPLTLVAALALPVFWKKQKWFIVPFLFVPVHLFVSGRMNSDCADAERYMCLDYSLTYLYLAVLFGAFAAWAGVSFRRVVLWRGIAWICLLSLSAMLLADYPYHISAYQMKSRYFYNLDYKIGEWLAKNTPENTRVALYQAGGIKFFSHRYIIDGGGVTEHTIWPYIDRGAFAEAMVDRGADFVAAFGPDWLKSEGLLMADTRFFRQVPLQCRGLYWINKPALKQYIEARRAKPKFGPLAN